MADSQVPIDAVNRMTRADFVAAFGDVAEHSPWVAERAAVGRPFADRRAMIEAFLDAVFDADPSDQLALVRAHPDLAGRAAIAGDLQPDSRKEQSDAGLDRLNPDEFTRFTGLNDAYRTKFGFPFILAVKGANKHRILSAFEERMRNDPEAELATAIRQVGNIIGFRLEDRVAP
jgi:2-oxo-4-hydroxy-4-carboxy-5-ureidoimidazoline decarboxylase